MPEQGCLLLGAGDREAQVWLVVGRVARQGFRHHTLQQAADRFVAEGRGLDAIQAGGFLLWRQQLHRSGAVAPHRLQQLKGTGAPQGEAPLQPPQDGVVVGEQVGEPVLHHLPSQRWRSEPSRQRERQGPELG